MSASAPPYPDEKPPPYSPYPGVGEYSSPSTNSYQYGYPPHFPYLQQTGTVIGPPPNSSTPLLSNSPPSRPVFIHPKEQVPNVTIQSNDLINVCPICRIGVPEDDYPFLAICCAVIFFPLGLLCCLLLRQKRCNNCDLVLD